MSFSPLATAPNALALSTLKLQAGQKTTAAIQEAANIDEPNRSASSLKKCSCFPPVRVLLIQGSGCRLWVDGEALLGSANQIRMVRAKHEVIKRMLDRCPLFFCCF